MVLYHILHRVRHYLVHHLHLVKLIRQYLLNMHYSQTKFIFKSWWIIISDRKFHVRRRVVFLRRQMVQIQKIFEIISGFVSCKKCFDTYRYMDSSTVYLSALSYYLWNKIIWAVYNFIKSVAGFSLLYLYWTRWTRFDSYVLSTSRLVRLIPFPSVSFFGRCIQITSKEEKAYFVVQSTSANFFCASRKKHVSL